MDLAASRTDLSSAFAAAFLVIGLESHCDCNVEIQCVDRDQTTDTKVLEIQNLLL